MKLTIGNYEVNITAHLNGTSTRDATRSFLNELAIVYGEASRNHARMHCNALAKDANEKSEALYNLLDSLGFYEKTAF